MEISPISAEERQRLTSLPDSAMTTGIAKDNNSNRVGVYGFSQANTVVYAESEQGVGLVAVATGAGPDPLAALFGGNVEITGKFTVRGDVTITGVLTDRDITQLQQRVNHLETLVNDLQTRLSLQQPVGVPPITRGTIGMGGVLEAIGSNFTPNTSVTVRVRSRAGVVKEQSVLTDANGGFRVGFDAVGMEPPWFMAATEGQSSNVDLTGLVWSNTISNG
jgi:hypothetical protein